MKKYLAAHKPARSIGALQALLDAFVASYNTRRPHRAIGRKTPEHAFGARKKARPSAASRRNASVTFLRASSGAATWDHLPDFLGRIS